VSKPENREAQLRSALESTSFALTFLAQANIHLLNANQFSVGELRPLAALDATDAGNFNDWANKKLDDIATSLGVPPIARFEHVLENGNTTLTPVGSVAVIDRTTQLMWDLRTLDELKHADAVAVCTASRVAGFDDWRLPTRMELESILDLTRYNPAIDTSVFPDTKPNCYWTSTPAACSPEDCAWVVSFCDGSSGWDGRGGRDYVRAVRSLPRASQ
jgi:hypothetical protein